MKLKLYTPGICFVGSKIRELLRQPAHVTQARVLIIADSKNQAHRLLHDWNVANISKSSPEFRQVGNLSAMLRQMLASTTQPVTYVTALDHSSHDLVIAVDGDGPRHAGHITRGAGEPTFVPILKAPDDNARTDRLRNMVLTSGQDVTDYATGLWKLPHRGRMYALDGKLFEIHTNPHLILEHGSYNDYCRRVRNLDPISLFIDDLAGLLPEDGGWQINIQIGPKDLTILLERDGETADVITCDDADPHERILTALKHALENS